MSAATGTHFPSPCIDGCLDLTNYYWLETLYCKMDCNSMLLNPAACIESEYFRIPSLNETFYLQACTSSNDEFTIWLNRVFLDSAKRLDIGFTLEAFFTLFQNKEKPKLKVMNCRIDEISVSYPKNILTSSLNGKLSMKIFIRAAELTPLLDENYKQQTEMLKDIVKRFDEDGKKTEQMLFLLERESYDDVFSGRQDMSFATYKCILISRTFQYVNEIAHKFTMKLKNKTYVEQTPLGIYLGFIFSGHLNGIKEKECVKLFIQSHRYGLDFLKDECIEFLMKHVGDNTDLLIEVLKTADVLNDEFLMNKALDIFLKNVVAITFSDGWQKLEHDALPVVESILESAVRKRMAESGRCS